MACEKIKADEKLKNGFNAIGFSQGGQFLRAAAQRCSDISMKTLVSVGGQHQGVFGFPKCLAEDSEICDEIRHLLTMGAYLEPVQNNLVQAQYWHDPIKSDEYVEKSVFLAEINNEADTTNDYAKNLQKLENFVMIRFNNDTMVQPRASQWFGFYEPGQDHETQDLQHSDIYEQQKLGLKAMDEAGKLHFLATNGDHLQFTQEWFTANVINPFLKP